MGVDNILVRFFDMFGQKALLLQSNHLCKNIITTHENIGDAPCFFNRKQVSASFDASARKAGIEDFTFRDLRHTFASHFVMRGGSLKELQKILGHKTMNMTLR